MHRQAQQFPTGPCPEILEELHSRPGQCLSHILNARLKTEALTPGGVMRI
jgi:hypothetical protein